MDVFSTACSVCNTSFCIGTRTTAILDHCHRHQTASGSQQIQPNLLISRMVSFAFRLVYQFCRTDGKTMRQSGGVASNSSASLAAIPDLIFPPYLALGEPLNPMGHGHPLPGAVAMGSGDFHAAGRGRMINPVPGMRAPQPMGVEGAGRSDHRSEADRYDRHSTRTQSHVDAERGRLSVTWCWGGLDAFQARRGSSATYHCCLSSNMYLMRLLCLQIRSRHFDRVHTRACTYS